MPQSTSQPVASTPADASELAARCEGITKEFGSGQTRVQVLRGVNFSVRLGEMMFLVGPSGCGKTTLISVLAGLLTPNSGSLEVLGKSLNKLRGGRLVDFRAANIGFIFQQFNLLPTLTAAENAAVPLLGQYVSFGRAVKQAGEMLDRLGLQAHKHKYPSQLSGGQQQRVAIARSLVHSPRLVICDEPTASLDAETGQTVMKLLRELAVTPQRAVIVVTHDDRIYKYADRISSMIYGRIIDVTLQGGVASASALAGSPN
ncbi:MAG: ABC transporter ATP-binding protein [Pirellulaceae bacterium]|nr:ABC transporter ATP-binding protein [Pirellulaceae bacterium]